MKKKILTIVVMVFALAMVLTPMVGIARQEKGKPKEIFKYI